MYHVMKNVTAVYVEDGFLNLKLRVKFLTYTPEFTINTNLKTNATHEHLLTEIRFIIFKQE